MRLGAAILSRSPAGFGPFLLATCQSRTALDAARGRRGAGSAFRLPGPAVSCYGRQLSSCPIAAHGPPIQVAI
jgi:hypothetical protein